MEKFSKREIGDGEDRVNYSTDDIVFVLVL